MAENLIITSDLPVTVGEGGRGALTMFNENEYDLELELEAGNNTTRVSRDEAATPEQRSDRLVLNACARAAVSCAGKAFYTRDNTFASLQFGCCPASMRATSPSTSALTVATPSHRIG